MMDAGSFIFKLAALAGIALVLGVLVVGAVCLALGVGLGSLING